MEIKAKQWKDALPHMFVWIGALRVWYMRQLCRSIRTFNLEQRVQNMQLISSLDNLDTHSPYPPPYFYVPVLPLPLPFPQISVAFHSPPLDHSTRNLSPDECAKDG